MGKLRTDGALEEEDLRRTVERCGEERARLQEELDRLEEEGMLFFAEYPGGHFRRVSRGEVVNPNPSYTGTVRIYQKEDAGT